MTYCSGTKPDGASRRQKNNTFLVIFQEILSCIGLVLPRHLLSLVWIEGNLDADKYIDLLKRHVIDYINDW